MAVAASPALTHRTGAAYLAASVLCFGLTFYLRYISYDFNNDDYVPIAKARQLLHGELPFRDFVDPGFYLQIFATAGLQALFGHHLLSEALIAIFFISLAGAMICWLVAASTGSIPLGVTLAILNYATYPKFYNYPKVFPYVLGAWAIWLYARNPSVRSGVVLGLSVLVALFYRHDAGVYVGLGAVVVLVACHWRTRKIPRPAMACILTGLAGLAPFLLFLQLNGGILEYGRQAREFIVGVSAFESTFTRPVLTIDTSQPLVSIAQPPPTTYPVVVQWQPTTAGDRAALEKSLELRNPRPRPDGRVDYDLADGSSAAIGALRSEASIVAVEGVDFGSLQPTGAPREGPMARLQRSIPLLRMSILPGVIAPINGLTWLYWSFVALPPVTLVLVLLRHRQLAADSRAPIPWLIALALMCAVAQQGLLRLPLEDRIADVAAPTAILAGWVLSRWLGWRPSFLRGRAAAKGARAGTVGLVMLMIWLTWASIGTFSPISGLFSLEGLRAAIQRGPGGAATQLGAITGTLATSPPVNAWQGPGSLGLRPLTEWLNACTAPTDRVFATWFAPEVYFYADRPFGAGQVFLMPALWKAPEDQLLMINRMRGQSLPVVIAEMTHYENISRGIPMVDEYLSRHYWVAKEEPFGHPQYRYRIWIHEGARPAGVYEPLGLPCMR